MGVVKNSFLEKHLFKTIVFLAVFYVLTSLSGGDVSFAQSRKNAIFTVANFPVEATAEDAVKAKTKAVDQGQVAAFRFLLRRLTSFSDASRLPNIDPQIVASALEGYSVRSERNSNVQYLAMLDFNFSPDAVRNFLQTNGLPILEVQSAPIVLLPVFYAGSQGKPDPKQQTAWSKAWSEQDLSGSLSPMILADAKQDLTPDKIAQIISGDASVLQPIGADYAATYKTDFFVMAIVSPGDGGKSIQVRLIGKDATGDMLLDRTYRVPGNKMGDAFKEAASLSVGIIEGRWKVLKSQGGSGSEAISGVSGAGELAQSILITVEFSSLQEWQQIRQQLTEIPGIQNLEFGSVSARGAEVSLNYPGGAEQFGQTLGSLNLSLQNQDGAWVLRKM